MMTKHSMAAAALVAAFFAAALPSSAGVGDSDAFRQLVGSGGGGVPEVAAVTAKEGAPAGASQAPDGCGLVSAYLTTIAELPKLTIGRQKQKWPFDQSVYDYQGFPEVAYDTREIDGKLSGLLPAIELNCRLGDKKLAAKLIGGIAQARTSPKPLAILLQGCANDGLHWQPDNRFARGYSRRQVDEMLSNAQRMVRGIR